MVLCNIRQLIASQAPIWGVCIKGRPFRCRGDSGDFEMLFVEFVWPSSIQAKGFFFKPSLKNKTTVFSVGTRGDVLGQVYYLGHVFLLCWCLLLQELEAPIIVPHSQQKTEQKYPFEMLFRSIQVNSWFLFMIYIFVSVRYGGQRLPRVFVCVRVLYPGR